MVEGRGGEKGDEVAIAFEKGQASRGQNFYAFQTRGVRVGSSEGEGFTHQIILANSIDSV